MLEEFIMKTLNGKYHKYCSGWALEVQICKNGQTNCCHDTFVNKPTNAGFKEGKCIDFAFKSSKDEIIINLTSLKEVEVKKKVRINNDFIIYFLADDDIYLVFPETI